ncbi:hypothetical protein PGT21_002743 [Puccinia graminis f. sp. tritici]|uniref:Uncharacterized protein n=1 Tax=Puccinia graminis f. sp. tritici TaxID=56615 RepID=A0A5B0MN35_PUCGR|nr:hypothetical protein PGT21_002743 [Puccinia graminis f. sp. tritici]KAA1137439.1 hypothetical protein PGTUg99_014546 [Puccinia graminis f. sp. tritici]
MKPDVLLTSVMSAVVVASPSVTCEGLLHCDYILRIVMFNNRLSFAMSIMSTAFRTCTPRKYHRR